MAAKKNTTPTTEEITDILKVTKGTFDCCVVGTTPIILNRLSEKAKRELLMPRGRKNAAERATSLKHQPYEEFRAAPYTMADDKSPTWLAHKAAAFKRAMANVAVDIPGARKAQIGRLTFVEGELVNLYGLPKFYMTPVRSADMNRTPDIRTRVIVPRWACRLQITYVQPLIRAQAVANLLAASGIIMGTGDNRPEKGADGFGQYRVADQDDPEFLEIVRTGGRDAQLEGMEHPVCYDDDSMRLLSWYEEELSRRQLRGVA